MMEMTKEDKILKQMKQERKILNADKKSMLQLCDKKPVNNDKTTTLSNSLYTPTSFATTTTTGTSAVTYYHQIAPTRQLFYLLSLIL